MSLICISRGSFLGAKKLAESIAEKLQISCISRELTIQVAEDLGITEGQVNETETTSPWFLSKLSGEAQTHLVAIRAALLKQAIQGEFVYHGNVGHLLLADVPTVLRIRVVAPDEIRIESGMAYLGCSRRKAEAYLHRVDRERREWARAIYDVDWTDSSLYDLTINLEFLGIDEACDLVTRLATFEPYRRTAAIQEQIENLALASRVEAIIGLSLSQNLAITAEAGRVTIHGTSIFRAREAEIEEIARGIDGVREVACELDCAAARMGF